jgi:hypothetical protein
MSEIGAPRKASGESGEPGAAPRPSHSPIRSRLFVVASILVAIASVIVAVEFFVVERLPALTEASLESAKKQWKSGGPHSYIVEIELRGAQPGMIHVEVQDGEVTATTRDKRVPPKWTWDTWSVPGMFETLEQDLQIAEDPAQQIQAAPGTKWQLRCEFDPKYGYPHRYHRFVTGGPEVYWRVTRFEPN